MRMTTRAAGIALAATAGALMFGSPAQADGWNNNAQVVPGQLCNSDVAAAIGVQVPVASPEVVGGPCINGAVQD